jgi:hypothetical protein
LIADPDKGMTVFCNENHKDTYVVKSKVDLSINHRNDRAIRVAAHYYAGHIKGLGPDNHVILITDDGENRMLAKKEAGEWMKSMSIREYVEFQKEIPDLADLIADDDEMAASMKRFTYTEVFNSRLIRSIFRRLRSLRF